MHVLQHVSDVPWWDGWADCWVPHQELLRSFSQNASEQVRLLRSLWAASSSGP